MSPLGTLLPPEPSVYPKLSHFGPPFVFNGLRTLYLSCGSFSRSDRLFSIACALFDKNTGGGIPPSSPAPHLRPLLPSHPLSVSTFRINTCESVSKQTTSSPFRINTYEKTGEGEGGTCSSGPPFGPEAFYDFCVQLGKAAGRMAQWAQLAWEQRWRTMRSSAAGLPSFSLTGSRSTLPAFLFFPATHTAPPAGLLAGGSAAQAACASSCLCCET